MKEPISLDPELLAAWARSRALPIDPARAAAVRPPVESLVGRLQALGERLTPKEGPPPESPKAAG